jgi:hypothetical protein
LVYTSAREAKINKGYGNIGPPAPNSFRQNLNDERHAPGKVPTITGIVKRNIFLMERMK